MAAARLRSERGRMPIGPPKRPGARARSARRIAPGSLFQQKDCTRRPRARQRIYACRAFRKDAHPMMTIVLLAPALAFAAAATQAPAPAPPRGFFPESVAEQEKIEREFRDI